MGMMMTRAARRTDYSSSALLLAVFCFTTTLSTLSIFDDASYHSKSVTPGRGLYNFGGLPVVFAWQSGTILSSSSSSCRLHPPPSYSTRSQALHTSWRLKRFPSLSSSAAAAASPLWISPSLSSSSITDTSESHNHDSSLEEKSREEFLSHLNAELSESTTTQKQDQLVFFPDSVPGHHLSLWKRLRRGVDKSYDLLKKKGRAGMLAYAFFNFCFYSIGFLWQWTRTAPADPFALLSSSSSPATTAAISVLNICCLKFSRVFAYLFVISNLIKLPKIFISALLVPSTESALATVKKRLQLSEAAACMVLVALLAVSWVGIVAIPISAEYVQLKRLVHLNQVVQGYIIQPV